MSQELTPAGKDKLVADMKVVISDAEEILRATAGAAGDKMAGLREKIEIRLRDAKEPKRLSSTRPRQPPMRPTTSCMSNPGRPSELPPPWAWPSAS